ncbi:MAG: 30S ribosomal protein S13 [Candidatus Undinarchaeales archaeon]|jgi:small subunit ribosomal protein S13|nr:30S ribosomal protein S13 [Candidatus Undinarchaeales archaeon]
MERIMAEDTQTLVRLMRRDLPGKVPVEDALRSLRGVSFITARAIRKKSGFDNKILMGDLTDAELKTLETMLESPHTFDFPKWMLNRRKDPETGMDTHLIETNLMLADREDSTKMKKMRSYRGVRHMFKLAVRGQRTRSTGRKNKTIGVQKKKSTGGK